MVVLYELKVHHFLGYFLFIQTPPKHKNDNMTVSVNIITTLHSYIFNGFWFIMSYSSASTFIFFSLLSRLFVCFFSLPSPLFLFVGDTGQQIPFLTAVIQP